MSEQAGVSISAIRFYERRGLLPVPERIGGQRRYTADTVRRLGIIGAAKRAGLSLDEVGALLASVDTGVAAHEPLRLLAARKLPEANALVERAEATRGWLLAASSCECDTLDVCALFS